MRWFDIAKGSLERWRTMRELRAMEKRDALAHHWEFTDFIVKAQDAFERDQRMHAEEIWRRAYATFPNQAMTSAGALDLLLKLALYDEAEALLTRGQKHHRGWRSRGHFLEGLALVAYKRGNQEEAVRRCAFLRKKSPSSLKGYWIAAAALSELGHVEKAEAVMKRGLRRMPYDVSLRIEYAKLAERRKDWGEALQRWTALATLPNPDAHIIGVTGSAAALKELRRYDEADQMLSGVKSQAANNLAFWIEFARIPDHKQDWEEAASRWATVRKRFPLQLFGYMGEIRPLMELGKRAQAEDVLREGIDRLPNDPTPLIEYALLAHRNGEWGEAIRRWAAVRDCFPKRREGYELGADALAAHGQTLEASRLRSTASTEQ
jgi:tetratricopeptide (TPR) repeat protein